MIPNENFKYSFLFEMCKKAVSHMNRDEAWAMGTLWSGYNSLFIELIEECNKAGLPQGKELANVLNTISTSVDDRNKCSYTIQYELLPIIYTLFDNSDITVELNNDYSLKGSRSGFTCLFDEKTGKYLNSHDDPLWEAVDRAKAFVKTDTRRVYILGVELGYFAYACWTEMYKAGTVVVFDSEENIRIACERGILGKIDEKNITILCSDDYDELFEEFVKQDELTENTVFYISQNVPPRAGKYATSMKELMMGRELSREYAPKYATNFWKNKMNASGGFEELKAYLSKSGKNANAKECVICAAGPSLAENIDFLRECKGNKLIIAISTSLRKLAGADIKPDLVAVYDPNPALMPHLDGVMDFASDIPLVAESVAYWNFVENYPGPVFRVLANDSPYVLEEAEQQGIQIMDGGRTVTTFAAELAVHLGAEKVYLTGADYAYPGNKVYADSTTNDAQARIQVLSVDGSMVGSTENFMNFIQDTENLIERNKGKAEFYNKSAHGAYIKGAFCGKWWEIIPGDSEGISDYVGKIGEDNTLTVPEKFFLLSQAVTRTAIANIEVDEFFWSRVAEVFDVIKTGFLSELSYNAFGAQKKNGLILLLTTFFSEEKDELSEKILEDAAKLRSKGKTVIILNSCEYLGGDPVALKDYAESPYPEQLLEKEDLAYKGNRYPYFQVPKGMPDTDITRSFLDMFRSSVPELVINYDPFSLMAAAFETLTTVEHR